MASYVPVYNGSVPNVQFLFALYSTKYILPGLFVSKFPLAPMNATVLSPTVLTLILEPNLKFAFVSGTVYALLYEYLPTPSFL